MQYVFTIIIPTVSLYSTESLGVDSFLKTRQNFEEKYEGEKEAFVTKMTQYVEGGAENLIFTDDLKTMTFMCNKNTFELLHKMMAKFNNQNKELRFGSFVFGPVVMRMYYYNNAYDEAFQAFNDPKLKGFFDQITSFQILCNLLYKNKKYEEVLKVFEHVKSKQISMSKYPKHIIVVVFASYCKMNTPESFEDAKKLWSELINFGHLPIRRAASFFALNALNIGNPEICIEALCGLKLQSYVTVRNLKIMAYADLNRPDKAMPLLREPMDRDIPELIVNNKNIILQSAIDRLATVIEKSEDNELKREFANVLKGLQDRKLIETKSIEDFLNREMDLVNSQKNMNNQLLLNSFNNRNYRKTPPRPLRQGLSEMY